MGIWEALSEFGPVAFVRSYPRTFIITAALVVPAIVLTAALGGFAEAEEHGAPTVPVGDTVETQVAEVTVSRAEVTRTQPGFDTPAGDRDFLQLRVRVRALADQPVSSSMLSNAVTWPEKQQEREKLDIGKLMEKAANGKPKVTTREQPSSIVRLPDNSVPFSLNPGLTNDYVYVWELPKGTKLPRTVRFAVNDFEFAEVTTLRRTNAWLPDEAVARINVPVADRR
ncbi:MAG TPA: hypothetical protein VI076_07350 [Actinopolymorphaceae bacterium]